MKLLMHLLLLPVWQLPGVCIGTALLCAVLVDCLGAPIAGPIMPSAHVHSTLKACCAHQAASLNDMCRPALARLHLTVFALQYPMF
jgi:hypothetical protein